MSTSDAARQPHDLHEFLRSTAREIDEEYRRISARASEDPGTAGDQGEENWASILRGWLPSTFHVVTKGRILTEKGELSPQVDVLVLLPSYPSRLIDKKHYLVGGVAAAFECKTTLRKGHIRKATETCAWLKSRLPIREGTPYRELHSPALFGLLAHSQALRKDSAHAIETAFDELIDADQRFAKHPREMLDIVCVADTATWAAIRLTWSGPQTWGKPAWDRFRVKQSLPEEGVSETGFICESRDHPKQADDFTTVGAFLSHLFIKLAWEHPEMRSLAQYFFQAGAVGSGRGNRRVWPRGIYTEAVQSRILQGKVTSGGWRWNEWTSHFL